MAHLTLRQRVIKLVDARDQAPAADRNDFERGVHVSEILNEVDRAPPAGWEKVMADARAGLNTITGSLEREVANPLIDSIEDELAVLDRAAGLKPGILEMGSAMALARFSHLAAFDEGLLPSYEAGTWWVKYLSPQAEGMNEADFATLPEAIQFAWETAGYSLYASRENREVKDVAEAFASVAERRMANIDVAARIHTLQSDVAVEKIRAEKAEAEAIRLRELYATALEEIRVEQQRSANLDTARRIWEANHDHQLITAESNGLRLNRAMWILHNMALERVGFWRRLVARWAIDAEPLRNDAANLVREFGFKGAIPEGTQLCGDDWRSEGGAQ